MEQTSSAAEHWQSFRRYGLGSQPVTDNPSSTCISSVSPCKLLSIHPLQQPLEVDCHHEEGRNSSSETLKQTFTTGVHSPPAPQFSRKLYSCYTGHPTRPQEPKFEARSENKYCISVLSVSQCMCSQHCFTACCVPCLLKLGTSATWTLSRRQVLLGKCLSNYTPNHASPLHVYQQKRRGWRVGRSEEFSKSGLLCSNQWFLW